MQGTRIVMIGWLEPLQSRMEEIRLSSKTSSERKNGQTLSPKYTELLKRDTNARSRPERIL